MALVFDAAAQLSNVGSADGLDVAPAFAAGAIATEIVNDTKKLVKSDVTVITVKVLRIKRSSRLRWNLNSRRVRVDRFPKNLFNIANSHRKDTATVQYYVSILTN